MKLLKFNNSFYTNILYEHQPLFFVYRHNELINFILNYLNKKISSLIDAFYIEKNCSLKRYLIKLCYC